MRLTTTINRMNELYIPEDGFSNLIDKLALWHDLDEEINLLYILDNWEEIKYCLWSLGCTIQDLKIAHKIALSFAIQCAERSLFIFEELSPEDNRPRLAIEAAKHVLNDDTYFDEAKTALAALNAYNASEHKFDDREDSALSAFNAARSAHNIYYVNDAARHAVHSHAHRYDMVVEADEQKKILRSLLQED